MPSKSKKQQTLMHMAMAEKKGNDTGSKKAKSVARSMSQTGLKKYQKRK